MAPALMPGETTTDAGRMAVIEQRGSEMDDSAQTRPYRRREVVLASLLGLALFLIPLGIDLARSV